MPKRQDEQIGETHYVNLESVSLSDDISVEDWMKIFKSGKS